MSGRGTRHAIGDHEVVGQVVGRAVLKARAADGVGYVALQRLPDESVDDLRIAVQPLVGLVDEHLLRVHGLLEGDGAAHLVLDWLDGATLAEVLDTGAGLVVGQRLGIVRGLLKGLARAHEVGVVHGRIGPAHVLLDTDGVARPTGFRLGAPEPAYLAPEARDAALSTLTPAADVHAVAALLVHLLTGRTVAEQDPGLRAIDVSLRGVVRDALATDPAARPADAGALLAALDEAAGHAYGTSWWTEAGIAALVGPAMPPLGPPPPPVRHASPGPAGASRSRGARRTGGGRRSRRRAGAALALAAMVAAAAVALLGLLDGPPPAPVTYRTDLFCAELSAAVAPVVGDEPQTQFDSSEVPGTSTRDAGTRAAVSCSWSAGPGEPVLAVSVGAGVDAAQGEADPAGRLAASLDRANRQFVDDHDRRWRRAFATRCEDLAVAGYDEAFACLEPSIALRGGPTSPGTLRVQLVAREGGQALLCTGSRTFTGASGSSYEGLVAGVRTACAEVLGIVRRD